MDRGPAGVDDVGPGAPAPRLAGLRGSRRGPRRLLAAGLVAIVVLLGVIAGLAFRLPDSPPAAQAAPSQTPAAAASLTVPGIYQRVAPSVVLVRAGHELGPASSWPMTARS